MTDQSTRDTEPEEAREPDAQEPEVLERADDEPLDDTGDPRADDESIVEEAVELDWHSLAEEDPRSPGELLAELTEAEARRDEYLEDVRRARAEFENYRKRVMREGATQRALGRADVTSALLDVLDDFDRTIEASETSADEGLASGVLLVRDKLVGALTKLGLERIDDLGEPFDPHRHEAVQQVAAEQPLDSPRVAQVLRPGYAHDGRVLRAAMVVVEQ